MSAPDIFTHVNLLRNDNKVKKLKFIDQFDNFHQMASEATGLTDFGPDDYRSAFKLLLTDLDQYPVYNQAGIDMYTQQFTGLLIGRLLLQKGLKDHPQALECPIQRPIFIIGMARTGTTVLHRILTQDPTVQSLPFWLANMPMPRPPVESWASNPYFQQIKHGLENSQMLTEDTHAIHPVAAELADECRWVLDQTFWSSTLLLTGQCPNYFSWYEQADARYAYEYHQKVLKLIANGDQRRWVLKDPSHMAGINALLSVYPDACIVQTHRESVDCMRSIANLTWQTKRRIDDTITEEEFGNKVLTEWSSALRKIEQVRTKHSPGQFLDIHMTETRSDPIGVIERIFNYFDLPITEEAHSSWEAQLSKDPNAGHKNKHTPPTFGLTKERVDEAIGAYHQRYQRVCAKLK